MQNIAVYLIALPDERVECHRNSTVLLFSDQLWAEWGHWASWLLTPRGDGGCGPEPDCRRQSSTIAIVDYSDSVTPQPSQSTSGTPPALATHNITLETRVVQLNIITFYTPHCTIATTAPLITFFACTHSKKNTLALRWPRKFRPVWLLLDTGAAAPSYQSSVT